MRIAPSVRELIDSINNKFPIMSDWGDWEKGGGTFVDWVNQSPAKSILRRLAIMGVVPLENMEFRTWRTPQQKGRGFYMPPGTDGPNPVLYVQPPAAQTLENLEDVMAAQGTSVSSPVWDPTTILLHELRHSGQSRSGLLLDPADIEDNWLSSAARRRLAQKYMEEFPWMGEDSFLVAGQKWKDAQSGYTEALEYSDELSKLLEAGRPLPDIRSGASEFLQDIALEHPGLQNAMAAVEKEARLFENQAEILRELQGAPKEAFKYLVPAVAAGAVFADERQQPQS